VYPATALHAPFTRDIGYLDEITPADPAAGANLTVSLGPGRFIVVNSVTVTLTTDANAANRFLAVEYLARGGLAVMRNAATVLVTASTTNQVFQFDNQHDQSEWNTGTPVYAPLQAVPLSAGWQLKLTVDNIQVGDTLATTRILVTRYFAHGGDDPDDD
jgi:hypothetical protein